MPERYSQHTESSRLRAVSLAPHPGTPSTAVRTIDVRLCRATGGTLTVKYVLEADLDRLRVPTPRPPRIADRLWEHTCFEIFVRRQGVPGYHEFNLAPSGEWAAYAFERYRAGTPLMDEALNPQITVRVRRDPRRGPVATGKLELDALIRLESLSPMYAHADLALALSAVVEERGGARSYWALEHPDGKPDFHHPDAFALQLTNA